MPPTMPPSTRDTSSSAPAMPSDPTTTSPTVVSFGGSLMTVTMKASGGFCTTQPVYATGEGPNF